MNNIIYWLRSLPVLKEATHRYGVSQKGSGGMVLRPPRKCRYDLVVPWRSGSALVSINEITYVGLLGPG